MLGRSCRDTPGGAKVTTGELRNRFNTTTTADRVAALTELMKDAKAERAAAKAKGTKATKAKAKAAEAKTGAKGTTIAKVGVAA